MSTFPQSLAPEQMSASIAVVVRPDDTNALEPARKELKEIFKSLGDINLAGKIVEKEPEQLGLGFSCDVFRAKCTTLGDKIVAVKRIRFFLLEDISFAKNLGREVRLWSKLRHPNILPLLGYFLESPKAIPNLVSEWMKNGTVVDYMKRSPIDALKMIQMVLGIASGLDYMHNEQDMIHADLKGSNILVSDDGRPLLADFGLSVSSSSPSLGPTTFHGQNGSLRWMAKELHSISPDSGGLPKHTKMTDMWSFGMVISELLLQQIPYASTADRLVPSTILAGQLPQEPDYRKFPSSFVFRGLRSIARNCWNTNPLKRPVANEVRRELLEFSCDLWTPSARGPVVSPNSMAMKSQSIHKDRDTSRNNVRRPTPSLLNPIDLIQVEEDFNDGADLSPFYEAGSDSLPYWRISRHREDPGSDETESAEGLTERAERKVSGLPSPGLMAPWEVLRSLRCEAVQDV